MGKRSIAFFVAGAFLLSCAAPLSSSEGFSSSSSVSWSEVPAAEEAFSLDCLEKEISDLAREETAGFAIAPLQDGSKILAADVASDEALPLFDSSSSSSASAAGPYSYYLGLQAASLTHRTDGRSSREDLRSEDLLKPVRLTVSDGESSLAITQNIAAYYANEAFYLDLSGALFARRLLSWLVGQAMGAEWELEPKSRLDLSAIGPLIGLFLPLTEREDAFAPIARAFLEEALANGSGEAALWEKEGSYRLAASISSPEEAVAFLEREAATLFPSGPLGEANLALFEYEIRRFFACVTSLGVNGEILFGPAEFQSLALSAKFTFDETALKEEYGGSLALSDLAFNGLITPLAGAEAAIADWPADLTDGSVYVPIDMSPFAFSSWPLPL